MYYFILKITDYFFIYSFTKSQLNSSEVLEKFDIPKENSKKVETILFLKNIKLGEDFWGIRIPKDVYDMIRELK
jgi:hypothetical protein